jgi:hypothetical protein
MNDRRRGPFEQGNRRLLVFRQIAARDNGPILGSGIVQAGICADEPAAAIAPEHGGENNQQNHE